MELDSGSQCTAIAHADFNKSFPDDQLQQPMQALHNFDGILVTCIQGYFRSQACFADQTCSVQVYVLDDTCALVIGHNLIIGQGMQVNCGMKQVHWTQKTQNSVSNKWPLQPVVDPPSAEVRDEATVAPVPTGYGSEPMRAASVHSLEQSVNTCL